MGLDMYLTRKKYVGANYEHRNVTGEIKIKIGETELPIDFNKVSYIDEAVCYWRKANAIHKWFVDNVQKGEDDCQPYYVSAEDLEKLLNLCKLVKEKAILVEGKVKNGERLTDNGWQPIMEDGSYIENTEEIAKILPTESGYFFGSIDYDEYYMQDIDYTIEKLEEILEEDKKLCEIKQYCEYEYQSSW